MTEKLPLQKTGLWISPLICRKTNVGKHMLSHASKICPEFAKRQYRLFARLYFFYKPLIDMDIFDLSTEKAGFTTTTKKYLYSMCKPQKNRWKKTKIRKMSGKFQENPYKSNTYASTYGEFPDFSLCKVCEKASTGINPRQAFAAFHTGM